jgi:hypothetical protein
MTVMSKASISNPASNSVMATPIPVPLSLRRAARPVMLAFHELSSDAAGYRYALGCRQFEEHLRLAAELCGPTEYKAPLTISFDDGHISNYTHALPLLERYACKAIFFVIVGRIGQHKDFMTWGHLRELVSLGHRVQSHSWSHKFLTDCSNADLREELARSKETLESCLGVPVEALSAPHGRWDRRVLKACAEAEYRHLYTSDPWLRPRVMEEVEVAGRLVMVQSMDANRLLSWLTMGRAEAGLHRAKNALKRSARGVLGSKLYYRLWKRFSGWDRPDDTYLNGNQ